jgi:hypothetical protein
MRKALFGLLHGDDGITESARGTRGVKWMELVKAFAEQDSMKVDLIELGETVGGFGEKGVVNRVVE